MRFWGPCDLRARGQGSKEAVRQVEEEEGGLGIARGFPWDMCLHGGFSLGRRLVSLRGGGGQTRLWAEGGRLVLWLGAGGCGRGGGTIRTVWNALGIFCGEWVCPVNGIPWLRVVPEPVVHAVEGVFEGALDHMLFQSR